MIKNSKKIHRLDSKEETDLFKLIATVSAKLISTIDNLRTSNRLEDFVLNDYYEKMKLYLEKLSNIENKNKTFFLFKDGSITECVKQGKPILLEDFNLPSQAMTERLNSLLEPDRSFTLTEDITGNFGDKGISEIEISENFQVFARKARMQVHRHLYFLFFYFFSVWICWNEMLVKTMKALLLLCFLFLFFGIGTGNGGRKSPQKSQKK